MWAISAMSCRFRSAFAKQQIAQSQSPLGRLSQRSFPHPHNTVSFSPSQEDNPSQVCTSERIFKTCPSELCPSILVLWPQQCMSREMRSLGGVAVSSKTRSKVSCEVTSADGLSFSVQHMSLSQQPSLALHPAPSAIAAAAHSQQLQHPLPLSQLEPSQHKASCSTMAMAGIYDWWRPAGCVAHPNNTLLLLDTYMGNP